MKRLASVLGLVSLAGLLVATTAAAQTTPAQPKQVPGKPQQVRAIEDPKHLGLWKASQIIGQNVDDVAGKNAGKIEDLMIDSNGDVVYAILSFGGILGIGDRFFAVPWSAMWFHHEDGKIKTVVLDVTKERLERAPHFTKDRWPPDDRRWGEDVNRYWKDSAITAKVKTKLATEKAATLTKVSVDTNQGTVRLSGTVDSEQMKQRAAALARQIQGVRKVENDLKVKAGG